MLNVLHASTEIYQIAIDSILRDGYAVIKAAIASTICDDTLGDIWAWLEEVTRGSVKRLDPSTWKMWWPATSRGRFFKGFCSWMATRRARRVVHQWATECIFDPTVGPYVISNDGFTLELPHPEEEKFKSPQAWWHVDQTSTAGVMDEGLKYLQMSVALNDNVDNGSCFACFPRSHIMHNDLCVRNPEMKGDYYKLKHADVAALKTAGCTEKRVYVKKGDVIVWDSRLVHMGAGATNAEAKTVPSSDSSPACGRAAAFFCLLPLRLIPPKILEKKQKVYMKGLQSGRCALETCTHKPDGFHPYAQGKFITSIFNPDQRRIFQNPCFQVLGDEELTMLGLKPPLEVQYVSKPRGSNNQAGELGGNKFVDLAPRDDVAALEQVSSDGHAAADDVTAPGALFDGQSARLPVNFKEHKEILDMLILSEVQPTNLEDINPKASKFDSLFRSRLKWPNYEF
jgi:hypothetical protein